MDSGHATMTSAAPTPPDPQPSPLTTSTRGPIRATLRPQGLSSTTTSSTHPHTSTRAPSHPHPSQSHRRSRSVDSIRHNQETTPTNHRAPPHSLPSNIPSTSQHWTTSTRASSASSQWSHVRPAAPTSRGSNKENVLPSQSMTEGRLRGSENVGPLKAKGSGGAPFKDRTNTSSNSVLGRQERKRVVGKGNSLIELAPPLNAARLCPIQQSTRTATVS